MKKVSAFVARGFTPPDIEVWRTVQAHLHGLRQSTKWFDFEDGESSEGRLVGEKVRERIDRNTVFIGLFTRRELFAGRTSKQDIFTRIGRAISMVGQTARYSTSTWALQESGYAIAAGRKLIFLIEGGIDDFPKLQDNLEYIEFTRSTLKTDLHKLTTMLLAYQVEGTTTETQPTADGHVEISKESISGESNAANDAAPPQTYKRKIFDAVLENKFDAGCKLMEKQYAEEGDAAKKIETKASFYLVCMRFGLEKEKSLEALRALARDNPTNCFIEQTLGFAHDTLEAYEEAVAHFTKASTLTADNAIKADLLCNTISSLGLAGKTPVAVELASAALGQIQDLQHKARIFEYLGSNYSQDGNKVFALACWEESVRLNPADASLRFKLGLRYEEISLHALSIHHYEQADLNDATTLNNMGVSFDRLKIKGLANEKFGAAVKLGETLSMANLAQGFLDAGFMREAEGLIETGRKHEKPHENIGRVMMRLAEARKDESEKYSALKKRAQKESLFWAHFGEAVGRKDTSQSLTDTWGMRLGQFRITQDGAVFSGTGERTDASPFMALLGNTGTSASKIIKLEISGTIFNSAIEYLVTQKSDTGRSSLLGLADITFKGRAFLLPNGSLETIEYDSDTSVNYFNSTRIPLAK